MNFFKRRRILKNTSIHYLVPVRLVARWEEIVTPDGTRIDLKLPRFRNEKFTRWFLPAGKSPFITIHLDKKGSAVWQCIDGNKTIEQMAEELRDLLGENALMLTGEYCSRLYANGYITFSQLLN
jgi:hypothetical protein